jgi:DNA-binding response OmpR family regulator
MTKKEALILLVEDNIDDVAFVRRAFQKANVTAQILPLGDGDEAIRYLIGGGPYSDREQYPLPALMLIDVKLPRKSGHDLLAWLQKQDNPMLRRIPVIILTSSRRQADIDLAYDLGANSYLVKPVALDELVDLCLSFGRYWLKWNEFPSSTNH